MKYNVEVINSSHIITDFDCGLDSVNDFLKNEALQNSNDLLSRTYVVTQDKNKHVIAYITICSHVLNRKEEGYVINRKFRGKIPAILIAQLGVDKGFRRHNIGKSLVQRCFSEIVEVSKYIHFYTVIVDAANDKLISYYENQGFNMLNPTKRRLYIKVKNIIDSYKEAKSILTILKNIIEELNFKIMSKF